MSERLRIALTKGRLQDKSVELFESMGLDCAPVLSGGRYDGLMEQFGRKAEAIGFAVDVDAVGACLNVETPKLETVIHYGAGLLSQALAVVDSRPAGSCELSPCRTLDSTMNLAREKGAARVLLLDGGEGRWLTV